MKEALTTTLEVVVTTVIPLLAMFLIIFLKKKSAQVSAQTENEIAKAYIEEITNAVTTAVTATSQTYVDSLKKGGVFDKEAQLAALQKSKDTALAILSPAAAEFIARVYGDINTYLTAKIEETVRTQKTSIGTLLPAVGVIETAE